MRPSELTTKLQILIKARRPSYMWGPPGVGKSAIVAEVAKSLKYQFIDERMGNRDPVDVRGLPTIVDGTTLWTRPDFMPEKGKGILFLDELNVAPPLVQAACYQLIHDRRIGQHKLPDGWVVVAAGNRETDRAVTHRMSSALANRFVHLDFDVDVDDWVEWALGAGVPIEVIAFIRFRPNLLHDFDPTRNDRAFPTPRSWEYTGDIIKANGGEADYDLVAGTVGPGAATELVAFMRIYKSLPDVDALLLDPTKGDIGSDPAVLYALCGALVNRANSNNIERVMKVADRMQEEFSVLLVRDMLRKDSSLSQSRAFVQWASKHSDIL